MMHAGLEWMDNRKSAARRSIYRAGNPITCGSRSDSESRKTGGRGWAHIEVFADVVHLLAGVLAEPEPAHLPHYLIHDPSSRQVSLSLKIPNLLGGGISALILLPRPEIAFSPVRNVWKSILSGSKRNWGECGLPPLVSSLLVNFRAKEARLLPAGNTDAD
jgi:hypothetical protein